MSKQTMHKALYTPQFPPLPKLSQESSIDSRGDIDPIVCPREGNVWVPVVVGNLAGHYCPQHHKVVSSTGKIYSPTGFECAGGKANNRKWRLSIRILLPGGDRGRTLGMWLVSHKLDHLVPQTSPRKSSSSTPRSSDDHSGGRTTTSSGNFGSSQGTGSLTLTAPPGRTSPEKRPRNQEDDGSPTQDDASPSKMLRKAFLNTPNGNSLAIPKAAPSPTSPNQTDAIGSLMQQNLAIFSPGKTPNAPTGSGLGLPRRLDKNNTNANLYGATPTPMHTPESPQQLKSLPVLLYPGGLIPLPSHNGVRHMSLSGTGGAVNLNNGSPPVISTGVPVFSSQVIDPKDYKSFSPTSEDKEKNAGGAGGANGRNSNGEPLLGRGVRNQLRRKSNQEEGVSVPIAPSPTPLVPFPPPPPAYAAATRPTLAALEAARAASVQHHVEAISSSQFPPPLPFLPRQDSGSSLDLAKVFDYGDFSPGGPGGLTGFGPLQRNPGGGSDDWGGNGVQSITFSFGGFNGDNGRGNGPHCSAIVEEQEETIDNINNINPKNPKNLNSNASTEFLSSIEKSSGLASPPHEMLHVMTPEGEAAAEEARGNRNVREAAKKAARIIAEAVAAVETEKEKEAGGGSDGDGDAGKELPNELSSGSSNLGADEEDLEHPILQENNGDNNDNNNKIHQEEYPLGGIRAEDSGILNHREKDVVQI